MRVYGLLLKYPLVFLYFFVENIEVFVGKTSSWLFQRRHGLA